MIHENVRSCHNNIECETTLWNLNQHSKECTYCFEVNNSQDCKFLYDCWGWNCNDTMDGSYCKDTSLWYEVLTHSGYNTLFSLFCLSHSDNSLFCFYCNEIKNSFACVWLKNKSYCILNKQYTKEEYEELVPKIIEHMIGMWEWGEFFPSSLSPFGYNETVAMEYFPMTREEVLSSSPEKATWAERSSAELRLRGITQTENHIDSSSVTHPNPPLSRREWAETFLHWPTFNWSDYEPPFPKVEKIIPASKLPEDISKIPDDILNWAIECEVTKKPFRIIKQELEFYRKHNLPIPRRHPDQRHKERMEQRNPRKLFERFCDCPHCEDNWKKIGKYKEDDFALHPKTEKRAKKMITTYAPERRESIYCEVCYERDVLG